MLISGNKKTNYDGIHIIVNIDKEKCIVESTVNQDRKIKIHKNQYYSKDGIRTGIKKLIEKGKLHKEHAINIDKLVLDALLAYDKEYGTNFKSKYLLMTSTTERFPKETRQQYKKRCVENRNSILSANNMELEYDTTNIENPSKLIKNRKLKYASKFMEQLHYKEKYALNFRTKKTFLYRLFEKREKSKNNKLILDDIFTKYDEKKNDMLKINEEQKDIDLKNNETVQKEDEIVETLSSLINDINNNKEKTKLNNKNKGEETLSEMVEEIKGNQGGSVIKMEDKPAVKLEQKSEVEETISSKPISEVGISKNRQVQLEALNDEERKMLEEISQSIYKKRDSLFSRIKEKISNIVDNAKNKVSNILEERNENKTAKQENRINKKENNTKKIGYIGQAGVLVGLSVFLGLNHHVPTHTDQNKQIETNKEIDKLEVSKQNNSKQKDFKSILQVSDKLWKDNIQSGDNVWYDITGNKSENNQIEDSINKEKEDKKENNKTENNKNKEETENNKNKEKAEKNKAKVITTKDILSTIAPGINVKELTKGKFYASPDGKGPTGSFEKHKEEDKIIEMIKVTFEDGSYKLKGIEDDTNLYKLKKKYQTADFSCHIKGLGWVNVRNVIDAKMKEIKKDKSSNKKVAEKVQQTNKNVDNER